MNKKLNLLFIFGTRPEAIKLAPVILKSKERKDIFTAKVCVTAQHREMLDQVLNLFKIKPDYDLNIMKKNQSLFDVTLRGIKQLGEILKIERPDIIFVQGDTTTTFVASLSAYYLKIKVAHIEAGLRTNDKFNPFPEEINRRLTDCLSDYCFAPTEWAKNNLLKEGVDKKKIFVTGNTVIDALFLALKKQQDRKVQQRLEMKFKKDFNITFDNQKIILVTAHRRESFGKDFENICFALCDIVDNHKDVQIVYPVHLNPNVQKPVKKILNNTKRIYLIPPLDYFTTVWLMSKSYLILTDSGGIQEEAPSLGKPVLVMRMTTERPEGIEAGVAQLVGVDKKSIVEWTSRLLTDEVFYNKMAKTINPYGDGRAAERIIKIIREQWVAELNSL